MRKRNLYELVPLSDGRVIIVDQHIRPVRIKTGGKDTGVLKTWFVRRSAELACYRLNHGDVPATIALP